MNGDKSTHITFSLRRGSCPGLSPYGKSIPTGEIVKNLGTHLDNRLTWRGHITAKRVKIQLLCGQLGWLLRRKSKLAVELKLRMYTAVMKPIWTYGLQLGGHDCRSKPKSHREDGKQNPEIRCSMVCTKCHNSKKCLPADGEGGNRSTDSIIFRKIAEPPECQRCCP